MYNTSELLALASRSSDGEAVTLASLQYLSLREIKNKFRDVLSYSQAQHLFHEAREQLKKNKLLESRIFTHSNPQLPLLIRMGIKESAASRNYDNMFGSRSSSFVKSGNVASMFSPAGYLTELYREAKNLHTTDSAYNLDKRRPDLANVLLSQENMDEEVSTLTLSNDIMLSHVEKQAGISGDELLEYFSANRFSAATPYHQPYETIRQSVLSLDPDLDALTSAPDILSRTDSASLLSIVANISPELHNILVEDITDDDDVVAALYENNFALPVEHFSSYTNLRDYYNLSDEEFRGFLGTAEELMLDDGSLEKEGSVYTNGHLTTTVKDENNNLITYQLSTGETYNTGISTINYLELIPLGGLKFEVRLSVKNEYPNHNEFMLYKNFIQINDEYLLKIDDFVLKANTQYSFEIELEPEDITNGINIAIIRLRNATSSQASGHYRNQVFFNIEALKQTPYLLKLNKAIRLCRATGLTPVQLESVITNSDPDGKIDGAVISLLFTALYSRRRYSTDLDDALVLAGGNISQFTGGSGTSQFDLLFNTPTLGGEWFTPDGSTINLAPEAADDVFARNSLLRGLAVNRGELYQLGLMSGVVSAADTTMALTRENISTLYRLSLIANLNNLTVHELYLLFSVSPFADAGSTAFAQSFYQLSQWMSDAGLSPEEVWMLTSSDYPETLSPEMLNLRKNIAAAVSAQDVSTAADDAIRRLLIAPYIAGALGLSSPDLAAALVSWCENDGHFTLATLLELLLQDALDATDESMLAGYLHVLAQYSLTVQALRMSEAEVSVLSGIPGARQLLQGTAQSNALARLMSLHYFHEWLNTLHRESSAVLAALNEGRLTTELMASAMGLDEAVLNQALRCVDESSSNKTRLQDWQTIYQILQWVNVATALNTMPAVVKQLVDIRLSGTADEQPSWDEWKNLSRSLEAALTQRQAATLAASTAGRLSDVLCNWFLSNVDTDGVRLRSRDDLYSYFLIDNQVSSEVKTTRLAEAISGIQLYINRALNQIEPDAVTDVSTRQFFTDWEMNSRYSTWGGVSRLVYYPENYIDPLQRIGQTKMMDELLQHISQSQLSEDTVEDAFKTYLARFETIADLKVISAYHDNVNSESGKTWFIGRGREAVGEYYWRNVDMSRFSEGKLAANAWSEWVKIDAPINAWNDTVRPVIFRDRLYVSWVEREEIATNGTSNPVMSYRYTLKLAFLRHDANWSSSWSYDITEQVSGVLGSTISAQNSTPLGLAASGYKGEDSLMILIYKMQDKYDFSASSSTSTNKYMRGMVVYADSSMKSAEVPLFGQMVSTLDITNNSSYSGVVRRVCYRFAVDYDVSTSLTIPDSIGSYSLTTMNQAKIPSISLKYTSNSLILNLYNPTFRIEYTSKNTLRSRQIGMMEYGGDFGDEFRIANTIYYIHRNIGPLVIYNLTTPSMISGLFNSTDSKGNVLIIHTTSHIGSSVGRCYYGSRKYSELYSKLIISKSTVDEYSKGLYYAFGYQQTPNLFTYYGMTGADKQIDIKTGVNNDDVFIHVSGNGVNDKFTAKDEVPVKPANSFNGMTYNFNSLEVDASALIFTRNQSTLNISFEAKSQDNRILGSGAAALVINKTDYSADTVLQLNETDDGVQYIQYGTYRIRLNTLLAPQLVSRANAGINAILSMETQRLPEPQLGTGSYVNITLPAYSSSLHGSSASVKLEVASNAGSDTNTRYTVWTGTLNDYQQSVTVFVPTFHTSKGDSITFPMISGGGMALHVTYGTKTSIWIGDFTTNASFSLTGYNKSSNFSADRDPDISVLSANTTPLDFNSSSALYYWELFYYVPMMCFRRLLQERKFEEARTWMNYVWNPNGYIVNGEIAGWTWNCRPLEETISWNANPLDSIDPDTVAQNDPTHYKVATFMNFIEFLLTRGDDCYRERTRDAMAEAKMWYVFALNVIGEEPQDYGTAAWGTPSLASAASTTTRNAYQDQLATIEPDIIFPEPQGENDASTDDSTTADAVTEDAATTDGDDVQARTANSLTGLFLPEYNPALTEVWATLRLRLFNLRNNLSIDGQPLSLSIYAETVDPAALLSSMVQVSAGGAVLPTGSLSLYRFPVMLERARNLVAQLTQFGSSLLSMAEHDDTEEFSTLLMQQGIELMAHSIRLQQRSVDETEADIATMKVTLAGAQSRLDKFTKLYDEDVSTGERQAMILADTASALTLAGQAIGIIGGAADLAPNTFGLACGGSRWGGLSHAISNGMAMQAASIQTAADKVSRSEMYRRRREEWEIQRNNAQSEVDQIEAQLAGMAIRLEAANLQVGYLETQQGHTLAQLEFMQRKFTNQALYNWMRGKLSAIYYQFFDIAQSCCLMAQEALRRELNDNSLTFIRGSAWNGSTAGFMAGETLLLNLAEMDKAWFERDERALEVTRTVSLAQVYAGLPDDDAFIFTDTVPALLGKPGDAGKGSGGNTLKVGIDKELEASVKLSDLNIQSDYKSSLGTTRRLKQVSVTLPALVGPYEDVRAVLSYGGSVVMPRGCSAIAVSHGMNDSGQFQLDFNDARYLPFEGIPVDDTGSLTLSFPDATGRQKALLESLNDIILHIRYTIQS